MAIKASAQQTIVDITDAYTVYLTSASYTFAGTTNTAKAGSAKTQVMALRGPDSVPVAVDAAHISAPTGVTVTSDGDGTAPTLTIAVTTAVTAPGKVSIPVVVNGEAEFTLEFTFGIAFTGSTGATGNGVKTTAVSYAVSGSGTDIPASDQWKSSLPTVGQGQWLWTRTVTTYTDNTSSTSYSVSRNGTNGSTGATGVGVKSTTVDYQVSTSGTSTPQGAWSSTIPTVPAGQYLWTRTTITYTNNTTSVSYSIGKMGEQGKPGANGADAISMVIASSNGTIFKNSKIDTTLTAHVYKGGLEVTGSALSALGTVKWYKDGGSSAVATGVSVKVTADSVNTTATYVAQLEG